MIHGLLFQLKIVFNQQIIDFSYNKVFDLQLFVFKIMM